jgi:glycosyltransferase involved in cell wall biosynthesis
MTQASVLLVTRGDAGWDRYLPAFAAQTRPPEQIVVVIDRPTTADEQAAMRAVNPAVDFVFNAENIGLTRSLNRGLAICRGTFVFRTDDDDLSLPGRIEKQLALFASSGADLVASWATGVTEGKEDAPWEISCPTDDAAIKAALAGRNVLVHASLAFRRDAILALGGYDETYRYAQDYGLYLAAIRAGLTFAAVGEPLVRRTYSPNSITLGKRYNQLMFSCAARIVHCAERGDVSDFLKVVGRYAVLAATPPFARQMRRKVFALMGKGA